MTVRELDDLHLPDGRRLALCEVGDPSGVVVSPYEDFTAALRLNPSRLVVRELSCG